MSIETTSLAAAFALWCVLPLVAQDDRQPKVQPRLSFAYDDHDVTAVVALIGRVSGQRISVPESLAGRVSIRLRSIPWRMPLEHIVRTHGHKVMTTRAGQLRIGVGATIETRLERGQHCLISPADRVGLASTEHRHPVQDVACDSGLDRLDIGSPRSHSIRAWATS